MLITSQNIRILIVNSENKDLEKYEVLEYVPKLKCEQVRSLHPHHTVREVSYDLRLVGRKYSVST